MSSENSDKVDTFEKCEVSRNGFHVRGERAVTCHFENVGRSYIINLCDGGRKVAKFKSNEETSRKVYDFIGECHSNSVLKFSRTIENLSASAFPALLKTGYLFASSRGGPKTLI